MWGEDKGGDVFSNLHRQIDRVFDDFTQGGHWPFPGLSAGNGKLTPRVNVSETEKEIEVTAELPGVEEKQIDVNLVGDMLTIKAEKQTEEEKTEKDYHLVERSHGKFERSMRLPCEVESKSVNATFKNGVLTIKLPKSPEVKAKTQKIAVQSH
jgi:HSP20 family protein